MDIAHAKEQVKAAIEAYLANDEEGTPLIPAASQRPLFLLGAPGLGKTAIMQQVADELGIGLVSYSMTHHTRQSALGLPFIVRQNVAGAEFEATEYTMSEIIASVYESIEAGNNQGILFLDEINCVSETLHPSMLQFLQFKTFGRHAVPEGWVVACAGNPAEYNRNAREFDMATADRLRVITIEPDYTAWRTWASGDGCHPAVLTFLDIDPTRFYTAVAEGPARTFVTARAWSDLSAAIRAYETLNLPVDEALIAQYVRDPALANAFARYYVLFASYNSDYCIPDVLAGNATQVIIARAHAAAFDERLAITSLLADALTHLLGTAEKQTAATLTQRDRLRETPEESRDATWEEAARAYQAQAEQTQAAAACASKAIECAYAFIDAAFGDDKEALVLTTELAGRPACAQFLAQYPSAEFTRRSAALEADARRADLLARAEEL